MTEEMADVVTNGNWCGS